jgi:hypothetical protein
VPNERAQLLPGMFVKAEIEAADRPAGSLAEVLGVPVGDAPPETAATPAADARR